ncbi:hypothetical protein CTEN210_06365 [Chaetoceros tenuissimus]|uniref:Uncharacterized protein n=1 Tax=Chaetoceros tenuissimus TaxID=426638 RepID=A0AAD3CSI5_9STRA|nr:hypothetical protein CTEN210_06365 [Chaetoceros tenuissimus]
MNISTFQSNLDFIKSLYFHEEWKDEKCKEKIVEAIEECNQKILDAFGWSMHKLDKHKPSFEAVEKVVKKFPSTLTYENHGRIPIQSAAAARNITKEYLTILAKEGVRQKVGGEEARGGLLTIEPKSDGYNTLQFMCSFVAKEVDDRERYDITFLQVFKELRKIGLLHKNDIYEQQLLYFCCNNDTWKRFTYLLDWDHTALFTTRVEGDPLIHKLRDFREDFCLALETGFRYHQSIGGLLY